MAPSALRGARAASSPPSGRSAATSPSRVAGRHERRGDRGAADPKLLRDLAGPTTAFGCGSHRRALVYDAAYNVIANPLLWFRQHQCGTCPSDR